MTIHNLTLPLYPYMPVGNVWAWDSPFRMHRTMTHEQHGIEQYVMSFHSEVGTRLMLAACYDDDGDRIDEPDQAGYAVFAADGAGVLISDSSGTISRWDLDSASVVDSWTLDDPDCGEWPARVRVVSASRGRPLPRSWNSRPHRDRLGHRPDHVVARPRPVRRLRSAESRT